MKSALLFLFSASLVSAQINGTNIRLSAVPAQATAASVPTVMGLTAGGVGQTATPTVLWSAIVLTGTVDTVDITGISTFSRTVLDDTTAGEWKTTLSLQNVDNTSDVNKPVSTAQQTALDLKLNKAGTATNDNAAAGGIGEYVSSLVASGAALALTTATPLNVTSISLTAGDWDVEGNVNIAWSGATVTDGASGLSVTTATLPVDGSEVPLGGVLTTSLRSGTTLPRKRFSLAGTTTVFLVTSATFSAGTGSAYGGITARRVR